MVNSVKRVFFINGSVQLPLKVGTGAVIFHSGGPTRTPAVETINRISEEIIVFETSDSTYNVAFKPSPVTAAAYFQPLLRSA